LSVCPCRSRRWSLHPTAAPRLVGAAAPRLRGRVRCRGRRRCRRRRRCGGGDEAGTMHPCSHSCLRTPATVLRRWYDTTRSCFPRACECPLLTLYVVSFPRPCLSSMCCSPHGVCPEPFAAVSDAMPPRDLGESARSSVGVFVPLSCGHNGSWSRDAMDRLGRVLEALGLLPQDRRT
jgi:hypothetical protein